MTDEKPSDTPPAPPPLQPARFVTEGKLPPKPTKTKRRPTAKIAAVSKPFYQSASFWSALLMVAGFLFKSLAVDVEVRDALAGALATLGGAGMLWGRWRAKGPLTAQRRK